MKKKLLIALMLFISFPLLLENVNAQYGSYYGTYLDYALTKRYRHPSTKRKLNRKKRASKNGTRKIRRKARHVSSIENLYTMPSKFTPNLVRRCEIV